MLLVFVGGQKVRFWSGVIFIPIFLKIVQRVQKVDL
jgi:hypothetical protein